MSSFEPSEGANQKEPCEEVAGGLFVAHIDASGVFDEVEEVFHEVSLGVEGEAPIALDFANSTIWRGPGRRRLGPRLERFFVSKLSRWQRADTGVPFRRSNTGKGANAILRAPNRRRAPR